MSKIAQGWARCYSQRKVKNSESKSQPSAGSVGDSSGCYSQRKVKNSESKSQPLTYSSPHP